MKVFLSKLYDLLIWQIKKNDIGVDFITKG